MNMKSKNKTQKYEITELLSFYFCKLALGNFSICEIAFDCSVVAGEIHLFVHDVNIKEQEMVITFI